MQTYTALYTREGKEWVVLFEEVELSTFGRSLPAARRHARQALAAHLDTTLEGLDRSVTVVDIVPDAQSPPVAQAIEKRRHAEEAAAAAAESTRAAVRQLRARGWSLADVADVLHVTPQAISKLDRSNQLAT